MLFLNFFTIVVIIHLLFLILFPDTGLGAILYLPISYISWSAIAVIFMFLRRKFKIKWWFEICFALVLSIFLLFNFVQDGPSPIQQLQNGNSDLLRNVGTGLARWVVLSIASATYLVIYIILKFKDDASSRNNLRNG